MDNDDILKPAKKEMFVHITVTQSVCVLLILLICFGVKMFFADTFSQLKKEYENSFCVDIDIEQVISEGEENEV